MLIQTVCTYCGHQLRLPPKNVEILADVGFHFDCPICQMHCDKSSDEATRVALEKAGVGTITSDQAREDEMVERFRAQMNDERAFARFVYG